MTTAAEHRAAADALDAGPDLSAVLHVRTISENNAHEHWRKRHERRDEQRGVARLWWRANFGDTRPAVIRLVRLVAGTLDSDNLPGATKAIRDGFADAMGIDDSDAAGIVWLYHQERGRPKQYAVRVEIWTT